MPRVLLVAAGVTCLLFAPVEAAPQLPAESVGVSACDAGAPGAAAQSMPPSRVTRNRLTRLRLQDRISITMIDGGRCEGLFAGSTGGEIGLADLTGRTQVRLERVRFVHLHKKMSLKKSAAYGAIAFGAMFGGLCAALGSAYGGDDGEAVKSGLQCGAVAAGIGAGVMTGITLVVRVFQRPERVYERRLTATP